MPNPDNPIAQPRQNTNTGGMGLMLGNLGLGAATGAISEGLGLIFQGIKDKQQLKQAGKMQELQIAGNKQLTDYNTAKQLQMWKDTSYGAQKEQMEKAGLYPGLMYGMGGGGGQSNSIAQGNVNSGRALVAQATSPRETLPVTAIA